MTGKQVQLDTTPLCHPEDHAEYYGDVVGTWGSDFLKVRHQAVASYCAAPNLQDPKSHASRTTCTRRGDRRRREQNSRSRSVVHSQPTSLCAPPIASRAPVMKSASMSWAQDSALECCNACKGHPSCNAWVYCGVKTGCTAQGPNTYRQCWLKRQVPTGCLRLENAAQTGYSRS
jgi:PAN domain